MKKILVMDDERIVGDVACQMLQLIGLEPSYVCDGEAAVAEYLEAKRAGTPFAAAILDLNISGGMGGRDTATEILQVDEGATLFVSSGSFVDPVMIDCCDYGFAGALVKPFAFETLQQLFLGEEFGTRKVECLESGRRC